MKEAATENESQMEELKDLFAAATARAEEKELQIFELEERVEKLTSDHDQQHGEYKNLLRLNLKVIFMIFRRSKLVGEEGRRAAI